LLIRYDGDVNAADFNGTTPLHEAAQRGFVEVCELLIRNHAFVNVKDNQNKLPLHLAIENGHRECAELLQKYSVC
jgi:ankyrin repeat protein